MLGNMLTPVFAAMVIAYLLEGIAVALQRCQMPRLMAVLIVFLLFMAGLIILTVGLLPLLSRQIVELLQELPSMIKTGQKEFMLLPERYPELISEENIKQIMEFLITEITIMGQHLLTLSLASVKGLISILVYFILVPILVFFFLKDKKMILHWIAALLPAERSLATEVWHEVNAQIGNYVRGKIWEILIVWGVSYIAFTFLGLQFAVLLSLFVGLSVIVPYVGATVMFLPVALVAYFQWGWGSDFAYTLSAYTVIQILDGNLLVPLLLSEVVNLHPVAIIMSILVFGGLWGIWGLFFAIPLATLVHAVMKAWAHSRSIKEPNFSD
ncbi:putative permease PerM [Candidatus Magnetomoraceae bacterium gMMP-1]